MNTIDAELDLHEDTMPHSPVRVRVTGHNNIVDTIFRYPTPNSAMKIDHFTSYLRKKFCETKKPSTITGFKGDAETLAELFTVEGVKIFEPTFKWYKEMFPKDATRVEAGFWVLDMWVFVE